MTSTRFEFQRSCVKLVDGKVANVGCNTDPADLASLHSGVVNCDFIKYDEVLQAPTKATVFFDCTKERWPFKDNELDMVVMGDIVEHLDAAGCQFAFNEAHRVAGMLCITVPNDPRWETETAEHVENRPAGSYHVITITEEYLRNALKNTGWQPVRWRQVDYTFVPEGYFVLAVRRGFPKLISGSLIKTAQRQHVARDQA